MKQKLLNALKKASFIMLEDNLCKIEMADNIVYADNREIFAFNDVKIAAFNRGKNLWKVVLKNGKTIRFMLINIIAPDVEHKEKKLFEVKIPIEETRRVLYEKIFYFSSKEEAENFKNRVINMGVCNDMPDEVEDIDVLDSSNGVLVYDLIN